MSLNPADHASAALQLGMTLHQQGNLVEARTAYQRALRLDARNAAALQMLGVLALQTNDPQSAVDLFGESLRLEPGNSMGHVNRGCAYSLLGQHAAAIGCFDRAIVLDPDSNASPYYNRGTSLQQLGRLQEAIASFDQAIALESDLDADAHYGRGAALLALKRFAEAITSLQQALLLGTHYVAEAHHACGLAWAELGRWQDACDSFDRALEARPGDALIAFARGNARGALRQWQAAIADYDLALTHRPEDVHALSNRANALLELRMWDAALAGFDAAIRVQPQLAQLHYNKGNALRGLTRWDAALASYDRAVALDPRLAQAHCNRGAVLEALCVGGREGLAEALASYDRALALDPDYAEAHSNRGSLLAKLQRIDAALASHERAVELAPESAECRYNRSLTLLLNGDLPRGFEEFEWRLRLRNVRLFAGSAEELERRRWTGADSLTGKTLWVYAEQGLGDTIQFCRYVAVAAAAGARVILEAPRDLQSLLANLEGVHRVMVSGDPRPDFDHHCPLLSLPAALHTNLASIPARVPYLRAPADKCRIWRERLGPAAKARIGLVWSGGFRAAEPDTWTANARRNIALPQFACLKHIDAEFVSLQKGEAAEAELRAAIAAGWEGPPIRDLTHELVDFSDTAALIEQLDLVVSVDTSTAHLAGALGKPTWLLNRFDTCWRWLLDRSDSPWYPTVKLYRQQVPGEWGDVLQHVVRDLGQFVT